MGNGIAHVFARCGYSVILRDVEQPFLDRALETIAKNLDREARKGKIAEAEKPAILARILAVTKIEAISPADFVIEAVPGQLGLQREIRGEGGRVLGAESIQS